MSLVEKIETRLVAGEHALGTWRPLPFVVLAVTMALLAAACFQTPKFWLLRSGAPESFEWSRANTFRSQATQPWEPAKEPAMRWRAAPAWGAYLLGLRGDRALVVPFIGLFVWLAATAHLLLARGLSRLACLGTLVVLATTGSGLAMTHWLGINDGWYLLGLTALVLARSAGALGLAILLCPWVDERFVMAVPLAVCCRLALDHATIRRDLWLLGSGVFVFLLLRFALALQFQAAAHSDQKFVADVLKNASINLTWAPLGWFLGWRVGWILLLAAPLLVWQRGRPRLAAIMAFAAAGLLGLQGLLVADHTRTCIVLLPLALAGTLLLREALPTVRHALLLLSLAAASLVAPYAHLTYDKIVPVNSLPWEIARLRSSR